MITAPTRVQDWRFCLAPMMQKTDRHFRYLVRLIAPNMRLYTEMITDGAIRFGDRDRFLRFDPSEQPLALQLGGADPNALAEAAALAGERGYAEVNLNCGCPSDRVRSGAFGACLMRTPAVVATAVAAMQAAVPDGTVISVKTRLGVDECYSYDYFRGFIDEVSAAGCRVFHIHARKAWLNGLSPRENREIPPLEYPWVYRLKRDRPELVVVINGGIADIDAAAAHLREVDGVMLGRHAYADPFALGAFDRALFGHTRAASAESIVLTYLDYMRREHAMGTALKQMSRHLLNFFPGEAGARQWRRTLSTDAARYDAVPEVVASALDELLVTRARHAAA